MVETTLDQFVKDALAMGKARNEIADALKAAGWPQDQVADALEAYADVDFPTPVPRPRRYGSAREAFLYIVYFALLGLVAAYVGSLAFSLIEFVFQDDLARADWRTGAATQRWGIASLVVGYPIFLYLGARLSAARRTEPGRRASRVRAWLTYVTLIFAALTLIGDLVAVVYQFLSGGLGARFLAKAGVVGLISGAVLWNYTRDAERADAAVDMPGRALAIVATLVTAALVIWAFTVVRSPRDARAALADAERLEDLETVVRLIDCHRTYFGETPPTLEDLTARLSRRTEQSPVAAGCGARAPVDPASGSPYRYAPLAGDAYTLCAVFERGWPQSERLSADQDRRALASRYGVARDDRYVDLPEGPGEACFEFIAVDLEDGPGAEE